MPYLDQLLLEDPELKRADPVELADWFYQKEGFDKQGTDRKEFETWFLGNPIKSKNITGHEYGDRLPTTIIKNVAQGAMSLPGKAMDAIKGDAEFPEMQNYEREYAKNNPGKLLGPQPWNMEAASLLGNDENVEKIYLKQNPSHNVKRDKRGNKYIVDENGKKLGYLNKPGYDEQDTARLVAQGAMYTPAAKLAKGAGVAYGTIARGVAGTAGGLATDTAQQFIADDFSFDEYDPVQGTIAAVSMGVFEGLAIPAATAGKRFGRWFKSSFGSDKKKLQIGREMLDDLDIDYTDEQARKLGEYFAKNMGVVDEDAMIGSVIHKQQYTQSQKIPSGGKRSKRLTNTYASAEEGTINTDQGVNLQGLREANDASQELQLHEFFEKLGFTDNQIHGDKQDVFRSLGYSILKKRDERVAAFQAKYAPAEKIDLPFSDMDLGSTTDDVQHVISGRLVQSLRDEKITDLSLTPWTRRALRSIHTDTRTAREVAEGVENNIWSAKSYNGLIAQRKKLKQFVDKAKSASGDSHDFRAASIIYNEYNDYIQETLSNTLKSNANQRGSIAYQAAKSAQEGDAMYRAYKSQFDSKEFAQGLVKKIGDAEKGDGQLLAAEEIGNILLGADAWSKGTASMITDDLAILFGRDSAQWKLLQSTVMKTLITGEDGAILTGKALGDNLSKFLGGKGKSLAESILDQKSLNWLKSFNKAVQRSFRNPNISATYARSLDNRLVYAVPHALQKPFTEMLNSFKDWRALHNPKMIVNPASISPIGVPTATALSDEPVDQLGSDPGTQFPF